MQPKPCRVLTRQIYSDGRFISIRMPSAHTMNRRIALEKGEKRKHVKLSRAGTKSTSRALKFRTPSEGDCICAKRYRRTLSHLM